MNEETILYRLQLIEQTLAEVKNVVTENKIQAKTIEDVTLKVTDLERRLAVVEQAPVTDKAKMWTTITDMVFKAVLTVVIAIVFAK